MKVWLNGKLVEREQALLDVYDHGLLYGDGVFEGIRVYHGKVFQGPAHLERLFASADQIRLKIPYTRQQLAQAMDELVAANGEVYIRLVVTRGVGNLGLNPFQCSVPQVFILNDHIQLYPKEMYEKGMAVIVARARRTSARMVPPSVKSLNYLNNILAKIEARDAGVFEAIMLNYQGFVAEATGDNIFIARDGELLTPPTAAGALAGITQRFVIKLARRMKIDVRQADLTRHDLYTADECFLTGTAAEVIPVNSIDKRVIGDGKPGPITRKLIAAFRKATRGQ